MGDAGTEVTSRVDGVAGGATERGADADHQEGDGHGGERSERTRNTDLHAPLTIGVLEHRAPKAVLVTLGYLGVLIVLNLFLLVFLLIPPLFPFVFYTVNGYLLGREYFELVALRRIGPEEARRLRKAHRGKLFLTGVIMALLLTLPVVNLLAPVVITAAMVHLFEDWRGNPGIAH
ncbi:MAG TPA: hypothetical protein EYO85_07535 [Rhodospirillales bacterium]|nr:hypothetical protein [Rhodospirillales bacterium]